MKKGREAASRDFVALAARGRWLRAVPHRNRTAAATALWRHCNRTAAATALRRHCNRTAAATAPQSHGGRTTVVVNATRSRATLFIADFEQSSG